MSQCSLAIWDTQTEEQLPEKRLIIHVKTLLELEESSLF